MAEPNAVPAADLVVRRLAEHGAREVFGYPGGQLTPIYDALYRQKTIRHRLARHEQAACFMADGYARATGRLGICLAVCGPGVLNTATPLLTAFTDSIPVLLISGQVPCAGRGLRSGYYHENDQLTACAPITKARFRAETADAVVPLLDQAWDEACCGRPGPVLFEVPLDVLLSPIEEKLLPLGGGAVRPSRAGPTAAPQAIARVAQLVQSWRRPLILAGGGVVSAGAERQLLQLAERLGAPVHHSAMGKGAIPDSHPLAAGMPWHQATSDATGMADFFSGLFRQADGLLALGCRFSQLTTGSWALPLPPALAQIDIDPAEIGRHYPVQASAVTDLRPALDALLAALPPMFRAPWATRPRPATPWRLPGIDLVAALQRALPADTIVAADVTRLAYILMTELPRQRSRTFLHPAGAVSMGYALPAALGAKAAFPDRPVIAVLGDGGLQMCAMELATAVQEDLPVVVVLINDHCLTLIKATQARKYGNRFIAVDLQNPDFARFAEAFGASYFRAVDDDTFERSLKAALGGGKTAIVEVQLGEVRKQG
jgi:acetolactate synthase-1/2/3 large subunit